MAIKVGQSTLFEHSRSTHDYLWSRYITVGYYRLSDKHIPQLLEIDPLPSLFSIKGTSCILAGA